MITRRKIRSIRKNHREKLEAGTKIASGQVVVTTVFMEVLNTETGKSEGVAVYSQIDSQNGSRLVNAVAEDYALKSKKQVIDKFQDSDEESVISDLAELLSVLKGRMS